MESGLFICIKRNHVSFLSIFLLNSCRIARVTKTLWLSMHPPNHPKGFASLRYNQRGELTHLDEIFFHENKKGGGIQTSGWVHQPIDYLIFLTFSAITPTLLCSAWSC